MILKKERIISDPVVTTVTVLANEPRAAVGSNDFFLLETEPRRDQTIPTGTAISANGKAILLYLR